MDWLAKLLGLNQGDPMIEAAGQNRQVVTNYGTTANDLIDTGATQAGTHLTNADNLAKLSLNAVGPTYQQSPGYQFGLNQGINALERTASARGGLGGGQLAGDIIDYATGSADRDYNNWLASLNTAIGTGIGTQDNLANLATGTATAKTGIAGDVASGLTGANNQNAAGETTNDQGWANLGSTLMSGLGSIMGYGGFGSSIGGKLVNGIKGFI